MTQPAPLRNGLDALLTPKDSVLILIDPQPFQFANLHSHEPMMIVNNVVGLAKAAKIFNVPTILTTVVEDRGGKLIKGLQELFPDQKPIDRTWINTWEDARVVDAAISGWPIAKSKSHKGQLNEARCVARSQTRPREVRDAGPDQPNPLNHGRPMTRHAEHLPPCL